jgi:adenine deaminase
MSDFRLKGKVADCFGQKIYHAEIHVSAGRILSIKALDSQAEETDHYILPGFIDAHVHVESSLLLPSEFARLAVTHGTVAIVCDPHEIANVCGLEGVKYMIENGKTVPFKFYFGAPSCVPATLFETVGAHLDAEQVGQLLQLPEIKYLSEMMNYPGVLNNDPEVMEKIRLALEFNKPVDGHAPGLRGEKAGFYIHAGISTDHECFTLEEALDKLNAGMKILIREGSAAKNFEALVSLIETHPDMTMLCSDDKHPDSLVAGHINRLCARAVEKGFAIFNILRAACINPVLHYGLDVGMLRPGDPADFIVVKDLNDFEVIQTYINGKLLAENGQTRILHTSHSVINEFQCGPKHIEDFLYPLMKWGEEENIEQAWVIEALDGQLVTNKLLQPIALLSDGKGYLQSNLEHDLLKIVVVNRYHDAPIAKSFIKNFNLKKGAIASSVAHDSHNIVAVGVDEYSISRAVNLVIENKGGLCCVSEDEERVLPLPCAGLMSPLDGYEIASQYSALDAMAKQMGTTLSAPFMTLSFMALLVIPHLKLSDMGLFDGDDFRLL